MSAARIDDLAFEQALGDTVSEEQIAKLQALLNDFAAYRAEWLRRPKRSNGHYNLKFSNTLDKMRKVVASSDRGAARGACYALMEGVVFNRAPDYSEVERAATGSAQ